MKLTLCGEQANEYLYPMNPLGRWFAWRFIKYVTEFLGQWQWTVCSVALFGVKISVQVASLKYLEKRNDRIKTVHFLFAVLIWHIDFWNHNIHYITTRNSAFGTMLLFTEWFTGFRKQCLVCLVFKKIWNCFFAS